MNGEELFADLNPNDVTRQIAELARQECAEHCKLAQVKARQGGGFVVRGLSTLEAVQRCYLNAVHECEGPEEIKVCGAPEGEKTYECKVLGRLMALNFEQ